MGYNKEYIRQINSTWHYYRRTPKSVAHADKRTFIKKSLKTDSHTVAVRRAAMFNGEIENYWQALLNSKNQDPVKRYEAAIAIAKNFGFSYSSINELSQGSALDMVQRLEKLEQKGSLENHQHVSAVLGGTPKPLLTISSALESFYEYTRDETHKKNKNGLRRWKNPRKKAVKNFIKVTGDKKLTEITRNSVLDFRDWWMSRILDEDLKAATANKDIGHLARIFSVVSDKLRLNLNNPFTGMRLSEQGDESEKTPFDKNYVQNTLLNQKLLSGLNKESRMILCAMADTGCGFSELTGLDSELGEINLEADIPYIYIKPNKHRSLKTSRQKKDYRKRTVPLVGSALYAFQQCPDGFPTYRGKQDTASTTINKFLRKNNFFPSINHSAYSLRHTFEDRLTFIEPPDKVAAALMGHKFHRPDYGSGPALEQKHKWLKKIAFSAPKRSG